MGRSGSWGLRDVTQSAWGFTCSALKPQKEEKNTLMGPISKNEDSKLMQMLSPSSTIYLCGLLPIRPKSYNLLTQSYTYSTLFGAVHAAYCKSYCQRPPFQLGLSFPCQSRKAVLSVVIFIWNRPFSLSLSGSALLCLLTMCFFLVGPEWLVMGCGGRLILGALALPCL